MPIGKLLANNSIGTPTMPIEAHLQLTPCRLAGECPRIAEENLRKGPDR